MGKIVDIWAESWTSKSYLEVVRVCLWQFKLGTVKLRGPNFLNTCPSNQAGQFDNAVSERFDVEAMINYCCDELKVKNLWVVGWSFGTDLALKFARDKRVKGLILLSPPLRYSTEADLQWWNNDGRPVIALVPEHDEFLKPAEAIKRFAPLKQVSIIAVEDAKHLWVGEPAVYRVLSEIAKIIAPNRLPLREEF